MSRTGNCFGWLTIALVATTTGCAQWTNPVIDGIPVRRVPEEYLGVSRDAYKPVPLDLLRQRPTDSYRLDQGDILGVYIEQILGDRSTPIPYRMPDQSNLPPAIGYPIPVQEGGVILLPSIDPINVRGKTLLEAQGLIRDAYTKTKQIIAPPDRLRMSVTLMQPRTYQVLVVREDSGNPGASVGGQSGSFGSVVINNLGTRASNGYSLTLSAYENDVLNALSRTGGLPGEGGKAEVVIQRNTRPTDLASPATARSGFLRIPLRLRAGEPWSFSQDDIILKNGDIVYVEARENEYFYTAGLIGVGQYPLPRDTDLDVIEAISMVRGPLLNGGFSQTGFGGSFQQGGLGLTNPSFATVLRRLPNERQINIRVDINRAFRDPRERIRMLPGDLLVMQQAPADAFVNYFNGVFQYNILSTFIRQSDAIGTATLSGPQ